MVANRPGVEAAPRTGPAVLALSLGVFMSSLDMFIVNLAFPSITRAFHGSSLSSLSWVLNGYTIVFAAVLVPVGRWADRVGRRRTYVTGLVIFCFGSLGCGVAPNVVALVGARLVQAVGAGAMVAASLSLLLAVVVPEQRQKAIGTWSALGALGAALGPVIGGLLVQVGWRWVFWINLPVGVATVLFALRVLPESSDESSTGRPDVTGAALLAAGVALVAWALVEAPGWGWFSWRFLVVVAAAATAVVLVVGRSSRHRAPVIDLSLLRSVTFTGSFVASILYYAGFAAFVLNAVEFLTAVWHYSPVRAGLAIAPGPLTVLPFARVVAPRLAQRLGGPGRVAVIGGLVNAAAQGLWAALMQNHPAFVTHLLPTQILGGMGVGLVIPSLVGAGSASVPPARFGTGSGVLNMGRQVGSVLGVAGLVAILRRIDLHDPVTTFRHGSYMIVAFFLATSAVAGATLGRRRPAAMASIEAVEVAAGAEAGEPMVVPLAAPDPRS